MFTTWNPEDVRSRLPVVLAAVGARRSGKSTAMMNLVFRLSDHFDMVVAFVGSAACCPVLEKLMRWHPTWDERFFFDKWNQALVEKLLDQQQALKKEGKTRRVLILMDDVVLTGRDTDQLSHMCMRGRHFDISCMMCAVSYTSISKRCRRSLDFLLCFGCPMTGDRKVLSWEYASNARMADFGMSRLEQNQCVVFKTGVPVLTNWKAELISFHNGPHLEKNLCAVTKTRNDVEREEHLVGNCSLRRIVGVPLRQTESGADGGRSQSDADGCIPEGGAQGPDPDDCGASI